MSRSLCATWETPNQTGFGTDFSRHVPNKVAPSFRILCESVGVEALCAKTGSVLTYLNRIGCIVKSQP